ncbi:MAG: hypothetical protein NTX50_21525 [Candidatus Sumerlaeota bacterium]|nr:hypothetical protein [Candidatus Sumerlaeota bacterium]
MRWNFETVLYLGLISLFGCALISPVTPSASAQAISAPAALAPTASSQDLPSATTNSSSSPTSDALLTEQLSEVGYLVLYLSSINLINGLKLSREQVLALRDLAREVEKAGGKPPRIAGRFMPDLQFVRDTYRDLAQQLIEGRDVEPATEMQVGRARIQSVAIVRRSLLAVPSRDFSLGCARCHVTALSKPADTKSPAPAANSTAPAPDAARTSFATLAAFYSSDTKNLEAYQSPIMKFDVFRSHIVAAFGTAAAGKALEKRPFVRSILTEPQRAMVHEFSCCLTPPKTLSDPMRVGQAAGDESVLVWLARARQTPEAQWPETRMRMADVAVRFEIVRSPGLADSEKAAIRERVGRILDRARGMTETQFEMQKEALCQEVANPTEAQPASGAGAKSAASMKDAYQDIMMTAFLLLPGTVEVYDCLLQRMDKK